MSSEDLPDAPSTVLGKMFLNYLLSPGALTEFNKILWKSYKYIVCCKHTNFYSIYMQIYKGVFKRQKYSIYVQIYKGLYLRQK